MTRGACWSSTGTATRRLSIFIAGLIVDVLLVLASLLAEISDSPLKPDEVDQVNVNLRELLGISPLKLASDSDVHEGQGSQLTAGLGSSVHEQRGGSSDLSRPRQGTPHSPLPSSFGPKVSPDSAREKT